MPAAQPCPEAVRARLDVSRETLARLEIYVDLLLTWNRRIGLIGRHTESAIWTRHILDSAQLSALRQARDDTLVDLGSGAGLPGLVLAILGAGDTHLVEANQRKAVFLREAARATLADVTVHPTRIEKIANLKAHTVTARALAPVDQLLAYAHRIMAPDGQCLFLKGRQADAELTAAQKNWTMQLDRHPSHSDPAGVILRIREIRRAQ